MNQSHQSENSETQSHHTDIAAAPKIINPNSSIF